MDSWRACHIKQRRNRMRYKIFGRRTGLRVSIPLGTPLEQINGSAPAMAGGKPELLDLPSIPVA
jgi:hypothetical protein